MIESFKILVVVGTVREGRVGRKIADWYLAEAKRSAPELDFELLDVAELNLPLFNETTPPRARQYSPLQEQIAEKIAAADGFVVVTGEYNHSIPGSLKNLLDYVALEWNHKAVTFVGYGAAGAIRAIEHLIQVFSSLGVAATNVHVTINAVWEALDEKDTPKPGYAFGDIATQLKELIWWTRALKTARDA